MTVAIKKRAKAPSSGWGEDPWDALVKKRLSNENNNY